MVIDQNTNDYLANFIMYIPYICSTFFVNHQEKSTFVCLHLPKNQAHFYFLGWSTSPGVEDMPLSGTGAAGTDVFPLPPSTATGYSKLWCHLMGAIAPFGAPFMSHPLPTAFLAF